jgi:hypothetical protein
MIYQPNSSWENDLSSKNYTDNDNQSEKQGSTEVISDGDDNEDEEQEDVSDDEDDCWAKDVKKRQATDDAFSESVHVICQHSLVLMDVMQNFREPGIDVQRYISVSNGWVCWC